MFEEIYVFVFTCLRSYMRVNAYKRPNEKCIRDTCIRLKTTEFKPFSVLMLSTTISLYTQYIILIFGSVN